MGMTVTEKIIAKHTGREVVRPGEIVEVKLDWCMVNDVTTTITRDIFYNKFQFTGVFDPARVIFIMDHRIPSDSIDTSEGHKIAKEFAKELGIKNHERDGVCHQVMFENYIKPGDLVAEADRKSVV